MPVGDIDAMKASHGLTLVLAWFRCPIELDVEMRSTSFLIKNFILSLPEKDTWVFNDHDPSNVEILLSRSSCPWEFFLT